MLPNFKRSEGEPGKSPTAAAPPASAPVPPRQASSPPLRTMSERSAPSVIGPDLIITGNLTSKGEMQIDGEVQGDIRATNLIIGERARITGTIVADEAVIRGHVMGSIRCKRVMLQSTSHVEGDVYHQSLAIEQGAYFEGKSRRSDDPMAGVASTGMASQQASPPSHAQRLIRAAGRPNTLAELIEAAKAAFCIRRLNPHLSATLHGAEGYRDDQPSHGSKVRRAPPSGANVVERQVNTMT